MLLVSMPILYLGLSLMFWNLSKFLLPGLDPSTRAAALFCAPQKTLAFGIPFIKTAFGTRPDLAYVMAPLLMYAPTQLLLGSVILVPLMRYKISQGDTYIQGSGI
jgi:sodium/bile acid cotransporter 7